MSLTVGALAKRLADIPYHFRVDVADSGVEFEDDRISYVVIQVDPDTLAECRAIRDAVRSAQPSEIA